MNDGLKERAIEGDAEAQYELGMMYKYGLGVTQDRGEAFYLLIKAAEQGHAMAQDNLGWTAFCGLGVVKDNEEAIKWLKKAAGQGHIAAQHGLGCLYMEVRQETDK